jgi:F-type H+-transporting ATPase subunit delta
MAINRQLATRYARALFTVAESKGKLTPVLEALSALDAVMAENEALGRALQSPVVSRKEKEAVTLELAKRVKAPALVVDFLRTLAQNGRAAALRDVYQAFLSLKRASEGVLEVSLAVAEPLSAAEVKEITAQLEKALGQSIDVTLSVDPDILGGLVVRMGSQMIDMSVKARLTQLQRHLHASFRQQAPGDEQGPSRAKKAA